MTNDTIVTVQGWVGNEPQHREVADTIVTNFRIGCTPRRFHRERQEWVDAPTQWYGVSAWRTLGRHCRRSLHVGDPVVVHGRLSQRTYERNGVEVPVLEIEALAVGHDLSRGVSVFSKTVGPARREQEEPAVTSRDPWDTATPAEQGSKETDAA